MVVYNFQAIGKVPEARDFIDIILSKTQRKTPTVVHKGYKISRIRSFYMRKVKYTQTNFHEKLSHILDAFPRLDDIHPFYADLINVLYSRDHYKLALGQLNKAMSIIDDIGRDHIKMLKFGDSLYRCKELKRAAMGRMCTCIKKLNPSLQYLDQVRQHLARLPSIDPNTRTLMITGYPNVGKSSFINKVSRADVEVQPYAFTTKSLFVGHCDYKYTRWQVLDTPGILDHPLEDRNTIEMQAITALAHLHSTVLYFIDISETCGYTIKQQVSLYNNIKPLFANKPLLIVTNKIDLKKWEDVDDDDRAMIEAIAKERNTQLIQMSNQSGDGVSLVKSTACELLLQHRVERKLKSKRMNDVINMIHVAKPGKRDNRVRGTSIPESVRRKQQQQKKGGATGKAAAAAAEKSGRRLERDIEAENGGAGVYSGDYQKLYKLKNPAWKYDIIPEIIDGKNISDFFDPDIEARLAMLQKEEDEQMQQLESSGVMDDSESDLDEEDAERVDRIRDKRAQIKADRLLMKSNNKPILPRKYRARRMGDVDSKLGEMGLSAEKIGARNRGRSRVVRNKRKAAEAALPGYEPGMMGGSEESGGGMVDDGDRPRTRSRTRSRAPTRDPSKVASLGNKKQRLEAEKIEKRVQGAWKSSARKGEADRRVLDVKPKWMMTGKRGIGKTNRR